jgi:hypothetical protein
MQQINGATQIKSATITTSQLATSAGITDGQLANSYLYANGSRALSSALSAGSNQINNLANGVASTDAVNLGQVQSLIQGIGAKYSAQCATTGAETFTIASGNVTQISGTTVDGYSPSVNDYILIKDAPATTGAGSVASTQPGNGLYQVTGNTTNLSVSRAADMSGSNAPEGAFTFVESGTANGSSGWVVSSPSADTAFTYGTTAMKWTQFSGAGEITVANVLAKSGNQLSIASMSTGTFIYGNGGTPTIGSMTGDVAISSAGAATVQAAAITLAKMANLAANSLIGNTTGSSATPTAVPVSATPAASTVSMWDTNSNHGANAFIANTASVTTAGGTTTLTIASAQTQIFTGSTTQTVKLPTTSVLAGQEYVLVNQSTGAVTVQSSGANTIATLAASTTGMFTPVVSTPTTAAHWVATVVAAGKVPTFLNNLTLAGTDGKTLTISNSLTFAGTDGTTMTFPGTSDTVVTLAASQSLSSKTFVAPVLGTPASGTLTNCTGLPLAGLASGAYSTSPTASTLAEWDGSKNLSANAFIPGMQTVASAGATTTLTVTSPQTTQITGSTTQTVVLPSGTTLANGQQYLITNRSTGVVTVNENGGTLLQTMAAGSQVLCTLINNSTTAGTWDAAYSLAGAGGGTVTAVSVATANGFSGSSSGGTTPQLTLQTSVGSGLVASNGSGTLQAATGANVCAPSTGHGLANRETPTGTINSSNTSFTLANTPVSGTEMLFQNGILLVAGSGKDYTISTATITFTTAPATGDVLLATYWY